MLLVIVGMPCAGKTSALRVCESLGAETLASGDIIREEVEARGLEYDRMTDRDIASWFHESGRERVLVERVLKGLESNPSEDFVAIDGFRAPEQIEELERRTNVRPVLVEVAADFDDRLERCMDRHRFDDEDEEYLRSRDEVELGRGLGELLEMVDYRFDSTGMDINTFNEEFSEFLREILEAEE